MRDRHWFHGIVIFHPLFVRPFIASIFWIGTLLVCSGEHLCGLGFKNAERVAPFVVASLSSFALIWIRRYRIGILAALLPIIIFLLAIQPAYFYWIHGPGRHHFPNAVVEPPNFPDDPGTPAQ